MAAEELSKSCEVCGEVTELDECPDCGAACCFDDDCQVKHYVDEHTDLV